MGLFKIKHKRAGTANSKRIPVDGEALEAPHPQLAAELFRCRVLYECPLVQRGNIEVRILLFGAAPYVPLHYKLFGAERIQQGADVFRASLSHPERSGRGVQEGGAALGAVVGEAGQPVVLLALKHGLAKGDTGRKYFCDTAFDEFVLGEFGVFQLVADGNLEAVPHQLGKVCVYGVMGKAGHLGIALLAIVTAREDYAQDLAQGDRIVRITLIKIPHPV